MMNEFRCKRIYEPAADTDGFRVLVDRLWPRGIKRKMPESIYGQRKSLHQRNFENGFLMTLQNTIRLRNFTGRN